MRDKTRLQLTSLTDTYLSITPARHKFSKTLSHVNVLLLSHTKQGQEFLTRDIFQFRSTAGP